jgi:prefoldin subunit 5
MPDSSLPGVPPDNRPFRDRIARHDQPVRIGASSETGPLVITVPGGDDVQRMLRELGAVINNLRAGNSHLTAQNTALTEALRKSAAATPPGSVPGQVAFGEYDRAFREALSIVTRERDAARAEINRIGDLLTTTSLAKCDAMDERDAARAHRERINAQLVEFTRELDRLAAELAEERRMAAEIAECGRNVHDVRLVDALTAANGKLTAELSELDAAYKTLQAQCEVHWLERQSAESRLEGVAKAHAAHDTPEDQHYEGDDDGESETAAILADPETMAAIAEGESELGATDD